MWGKKLQIERYFIPGDDLDTEAIRTGIATAASLCIKLGGEGKKLILIVPKKYHLKNTSLGMVLGEKLSKALCENKSVDGDDFSLSAATERTFGITPGKKVILAVYANEGLMAKVEQNITGVIGIVAVPADSNGLEKWVKTWNPTIPGLSKPPEPELITDPIVITALENLSSGINRSNALLNPRDKERAERTIKILKHFGHQASADDVYGWALRAEWCEGAADNLRTLWVKIFSTARASKLPDLAQAKRAYEFWKQGT